MLLNDGTASRILSCSANREAVSQSCDTDSSSDLPNMKEDVVVVVAPEAFLQTGVDTRGTQQSLQGLIIRTTFLLKMPSL